MKESGMEKLIELLNEYEDIEGYWTYEEGRIVCLSDDPDAYRFQETYIISKKYGFIKRLVDNDKIDFYKLDDDIGWYHIKLGDDYLDLLALLSIKNTPIEFLISILKDKKVRTVYVDEDGNVSGDTKRYSDC